MNLVERVLTLLRANLNTMVEKSDDPEKLLRQLQLDMRNQLMQVKTQVATAIAESRKLQKRNKEKQAEADVWYKKAEQAVRQNNDNAARDALGRYNDLVRQIQRYQQQEREQAQFVTTMRGILRQLEAKISEVETTIELLVTRKRNALLQQRVFDALNKTGAQGDKERSSRAQDAVLEAEARALALADLRKRDLDVQLNQLSQEQLLEAQLEEMKNSQRPLLQGGQPHVAPLVPPLPQEGEPSKKRRAPGAGTNEPSTPPSAKELDIAQLKKLMGQ